MSTSNIISAQEPLRLRLRERVALPAFAGALLLSAFLLFSVQPMFAKMILPSLGGSPAVWSVAMVFFQFMLLLGYLWAHALTRLLPLWGAALAHLGVTLGAFAALPLGWPDAPPPAQGAHALWLVGAFAASVGPPFFALAGNGPLLQAWFARSGHPAAGDPYLLYAASNAGSFAALLAYPFVIEPVLGLRAQSLACVGGYAALSLALILCVALLYGASQGDGASAARQDAGARPRVVWRDRLVWVGLSSVPSGLLVAVTAHLSTDVAAAPLLWTAPLALFLLTFILAFRDRPPLSARVQFLAQGFLTALALSFCAGGVRSVSLQLAVHLLLLFVACLAMHHALYKRRPPAAALTDFYLCMSFGGALGGLFAALIAPAVFSDVHEYPILIVAALAWAPGLFAARKGGLRTAVTFLVFDCVTLMAIYALTRGVALSDGLRAAVVAGLAAPILILRQRPGLALGFAALAALVAVSTSSLLYGKQSHRSFFGVHKIADWDGGRARVLMHGTTIHGILRLRNEDGTPVAGRPRPTGYYTFDGPIGEAIRSARLRAGGRLDHVAAIGLGAGTLACHMRDGEAIAFYEIDSLVVDLARESARFPFLSACAPQAPIVLGDARLTLAGQAARSDVIVVDAFSSDAIPTHLLTREAVALYLSKLAPAGVIVLHVSNRTLDLSPTVARVAADLGLVAFHRLDSTTMGEDYHAGSRVIALTRQPADFGALALEGGQWLRLEPDLSRRVWSDDYSTILVPALDMRRSR
jgi:hypothetical protein